MSTFDSRETFDAGVRFNELPLPRVFWDGLELNDERDDGTSLIVTDFAGWYGLPAVEPNDVSRALVDGMAPGPKVIGARDMTLEGYVVGNGRATRRSLVGATNDLVSRAARRDMTLMTVGDPILDLELQAEVRAVGALEHTWVGPLALQYTVPLRADDPRLYGTQLQEVVLARGATDTGRVYSTSALPTAPNIRGPYPWRYASPDTGSSAVLTNEGNADAPLLLIYDGDLGQSRVTDGETAVLLESLSPGERIYVNSESLFAWAPGGQGRAVYVRPGSRPLLLAPQSSQRISLYTPTGAGSVTIQWRSAWL